MDQPQPELLKRTGGRLGRRTASGAGLLYLLSVALKGITFVTTLVLARILVPGDFGLVALASTIVGLIDILSNVQTSAALIKEKEPEKAHFDTAFTINALRGLLTAGVLAAIAAPFAAWMESPELEGVLYALTIPALATGLTNPYFILYARNLDFRLETTRRGLSALVGSAVAIALAYLTRSYWALVFSSIASAVVLAALSWWRVPGRPGLSLARFGDIFGFGSWLVLFRALQFAGNRFDYIFIPRVLDKATLGAYHVSGQINRTAGNDLVLALSRALFSAFSMMVEDRDRLRRNYVKVQAVAVATSLPVGVGMGLLAEPLILVALGPQWDLAIRVTQVLAPVLSLQALAAGSEGVAMALDRTRDLAIRSAIFVTARTGLVVAGFYLGGFPGFLVGRAVASGLVFPAYNLWLGAQLTGGRWWQSLAASWRGFAAAGVMAAGLLLLPDPMFRTLPFLELLLHFAGRVALAAALYVGALALFWRLSGRPGESAETLLAGQVRAMGGRLFGKLRRA
jgi:PST family polysaccharide transporter